MACTLKSGKIKPCAGLVEVWEQGGSGTRLQGVKLQTLVSTDTFKFSRNIVVIKSGKHSKLGIIANHCPFCGGLIFKSNNARPKKHARALSPTPSRTEGGQR